MTALWEVEPDGVESVSSVAEACANVSRLPLDLISNDRRKEFMSAAVAPIPGRSNVRSQAFQVKNSAFAYS
jgi:hypothetical protein